MANAFIPYGSYWSTPFAKWQGALANLNSIRLAAEVGRRFLEAKRIPKERIDLGILGITNPVAQLREPTAVPSAGESLSVSQKLRILMPA